MTWQQREKPDKAIDSAKYEEWGTLVKQFCELEVGDELLRSFHVAKQVATETEKLKARAGVLCTFENVKFPGAG